MMKQRELVPKRRFKGFVNEWETYELKEILHVNSGRDYKHLNKGNVPVYGTGGLMLKVDDKLSKVDGIGIGRKGTINKPQYLKAPFWTVDTLFFMTPVFKSDLYFMYSKSQTIDWKSMDESSGVPSLSKDTIEKINLFTPGHNEQQKIGQFFKHHDEMITLEQRKIDKTKALKSGYLAEMFPAEGERVPKRRFEGFTDDWELFKLKDLIVSEEKGRARAEMTGHESTYLDANYLNGGENLTVESPSNVNPDDVLILWDGSHAGKVYHGFEGALGSTLKALKPIESGSFIYYYLFFKEQIILEQYRTPNIPHVINTFTDEFMIMKPSLEEQLKMGVFFKKIDGIITTHEQKLDKLKATKQAYLHEMFV